MGSLGQGAGAETGPLGSRGFSHEHEQCQLLRSLSTLQQDVAILHEEYQARSFKAAAGSIFKVRTSSLKP